MKNKLTILIGIIGLIFIVYSFKPSPDKKSYTYLTIQSRRPNMDEVQVCIGGKELKTLNLYKETERTDWNMNPLINVINQYESEGWELQNISVGIADVTSFIWMRKEKQ